MYFMKKYSKTFYLLVISFLILIFFIVPNLRSSINIKNINTITKETVSNNAVFTSTVVSSVVAKPFTILIVPGHDTNTGGASFRGIYERDLVVDVANTISTLLSQNPLYKVIIARDKQNWNPIFADYFTNNKQAILDFKNEHQAAYKLLVASGQEKVVPDMGEHNLATPKTAIELYGINKWADENNIDLIIHLHFNNSTRINVKLPGSHHGFDMFIPQKQSVNAATSRIVAEDIYKELENKFSPEAPGYYNSLFEDHSLIALGASNTLTKPAMLIEYAFIYEKILQTNTSREQTLEQMAQQTVKGIQDYVNSISLRN
jgi:N-acetylmuramoyl-L-alanine amidase